MGDGCMPHRTLALHVLQPPRHGIEVLDQGGHFARRVFLDAGTGTEVAARERAHAVHQRIQRRQDAMGKTERGGNGQRQAGQDHADHPCQFRAGRQPAFRLLGSAGEEFDQDRIQQPR